MKLHYFQTPVLVVPFEQHKQVKTAVLDLISNTSTSSLGEPTSSISKSNWDQSTLSDQYWQLIASDIQQLVDRAVDSIGYEAKIASQWFQQYEKYDTHAWHTHPGSDLSLIYYLELAPHSATEFLDGSTGKIYSFPVEEGDVIIFPSVLIHRSPVNRTSSRKTVIAANARASNRSAEMNY